MVRSFKLLLAAVMLMAVMCAGAAFAADEVPVDLKMTAIPDNDQGGDPTPLPNNEVRLWVTRGVGSIPKRANLMDVEGNHFNHPLLILYSTKPTANAPEGKWLSSRDINPGYTSLVGDGNIDNTGISYRVDNGTITLSADVNARSGHKATIYVYGGASDDQGIKKTSVQVSDSEGNPCNVTPFPSAEISFTDNNKNGDVITFFNVVVISSDADLILDQIEADPELKLAGGANIVVKDATDSITDVVHSNDTAPPVITVELAGNGSEIVVVSSDGRNIDQEYTRGIDPKNARAYLYLKDDDTPIYTFTPVIDPSGTITYRMDAPGLLQVLKDHLGKELSISFDDLNTTLGMNLPSCLVKFTLSLGGGGSSSGCAAGAFVPLALVALAMMRRRHK